MLRLDCFCHNLFCIWLRSVSGLVSCALWCLALLNITTKPFCSLRIGLPSFRADRRRISCKPLLQTYTLQYPLLLSNRVIISLHSVVPWSQMQPKVRLSKIVRSVNDIILIVANYIYIIWYFSIFFNP